MKSAGQVLSIAAVLVLATATSSSALTSGGTTLAGMHNGMQARHQSTMSHHRSMKRHGMMKHHMIHR